MEQNNTTVKYLQARLDFIRSRAAESASPAPCTQNIEQQSIESGLNAIETTTDDTLIDTNDTTAADDDALCTICQCDIERTAGQGAGWETKGVQLKCGHELHLTCFMGIFKASIIQKKKLECPNCRSDLSEMVPFVDERKDEIEDHLVPWIMNANSNYDIEASHDQLQVAVVSPRTRNAGIDRAYEIEYSIQYVCGMTIRDGQLQNVSVVWECDVNRSDVVVMDPHTLAGMVNGPKFKSFLKRLNVLNGDIRRALEVGDWSWSHPPLKTQRVDTDEYGNRDPGSNRVIYMCPYDGCQVNQTDECSNMLKHVATRHLDSRLRFRMTCEFCSNTFGALHNLTQHVRRVHHVRR